MAVRKYKMILTEDSITKLQNDLLEYKNKILVDRVQTFVRLLAEAGIPVAKAKIKSYDAIDTGKLLNSIVTRKGADTKDKFVFFVVADTDYAAFVEFGTGIVGMESGYPYPFPEGVHWQYASGKTIHEQGNSYGWFYQKEENGPWYFTQGTVAKPFMYETSMELAQKVETIAKKVFAV